ncbi:hypothetical protein BYT27DRAFT_7137530 [Phlegmacium glaucopus]|nr:hypothetical protein BYT27DRAFT_7137530 [Phlegmacium glaucopus]
MDDFAHQFPLNHRKRKADQDDLQDASPPDSVVTNDRQPLTVSTPSSNAPRQLRLTSETNDNLWAAPTSPQVSSPLTSQFPQNSAKRPRIDTRVQDRRFPAMSPRKMITPRMAADRHGSDIEDIGIVSTSDPGPSSGSLLRERPIPVLVSPRTIEKISVGTISETPASSIFDFRESRHIHAMVPLIGRYTLRELELDSIFRNPQLRHDLLFDPGLQFRPRRKREPSENYWNAVWEEVQTGCTCVTLDMFGKPHSTVCICSEFPEIPVDPIIYQKPSIGVYAFRMPSRIPGLLSEFLEVLLLVIQPLSTISGIYVSPNLVKDQMQEHAAQAEYLRSIFDPALIEQEIKRRVFDPSSLFAAIGEILKSHCSPMRDRAVDQMVQVAHRPGIEAFKAIRLCLELLELMKLDIANHQLIQHRPFLIRTSGLFEYKSFKKRFGAESSLHHTRAWLHDTHDALLARKQPIPHPSYPTDHLNYATMTKNQQIYLSVLKGVVDLIFETSGLSQAATPYNSPPTSPISSPTLSSSFPTIPETLYLDRSRLLQLGSDVDDTTALYMFMLLFRQLVFSESLDGLSAPDPPKVDLADMMRLKHEIRALGSFRLGLYFLTAPHTDDAEISLQDVENRRNVKQDIVLQIAKRANDTRHRGSQPLSALLSPVGEVPDQRIISVAQHWAKYNMHSGSALSTMLRNRLRDVLFDAVVSLAYPGRDSTTGKMLSMDFFSIGQLPTCLGTAHVGTHMAGMEALTDDIRRLAEKISRVTLIHLNSYLPLYETEGFLSSKSSPS